jgi:purine-binding chemotaxis protein CheW
MNRQFVVFPLADELYGIDIQQVMRIEKMLPLTRVPNAPPFVIGVCNLRGRVVPVIDLKRRLALPSRPNENAKIIISSIGSKVVGMTIDSTVDVSTIQTEEIEPSPALVTGIDTQFIQGVAKLSNRLLIILDVERILSVDQLNVLNDMG